MTSEQSLIIKPEASSNLITTGLFKIWKQDKTTKRSELVVDKHNTILYTGANLLAMSLAGLPNTKVSHIYIGYSNNVSNPDPSSYTITKSSLAFTPGGDIGYLRVPLTFPASFEKSSSDYTSTLTGNGNIAVFTILIKNASNYVIPSSASLQSGTSQFFEAGLIASLQGTQASDAPIARVAFSRLTYDSTFNLTLSWGIKISLT